MINDGISFDGLYKWFIRNYRTLIQEKYIDYFGGAIVCEDKETKMERMKEFFIGTIDNANSNIARYLLFKYGISFINQLQIDILENKE